MKLRPTLAALSAVVLATLTLTLSASASAQATARTEHFLAIQTDENGPQVVIATGPIHARGHDVQLSNSKDHFVFPRGTVVVVHHPRTSHQSFDKVTCLARFTESGKYTITGGTGAYAHVSGHGTYSLEGLVVGCQQNKPPTVFSVEIHASGPLSK